MGLQFHYLCQVHKNTRNLISDKKIMEDEKAKRKLGALDTKHCALFLCDIQEKFEKSIDKFQMVVSNAERVAKAANILGIPILATEQYPKVNE